MKYDGKIDGIREKLETATIELFSLLQEDLGEYRDEYVDTLGELALKLKKLTREL